MIKFINEPVSRKILKSTKSDFIGGFNMSNVVKKELEEKLAEFSDMHQISTSDGIYTITKPDERIYFLILQKQSEKLMSEGKRGLISAYGVNERGNNFMELNSEGQAYFNREIIPLIIDDVNLSFLERYENKLFGEGQKNDCTEEGFVYGHKHVPSVIEQNLFGSVDAFVQRPLPDESLLGQRGKEITRNEKGLPSSDTYSFVMNHFK